MRFPQAPVVAALAVALALAPESHAQFAALPATSAAAPAPASRTDAGDTVTMSRADYDALTQRVANIEQILGPDFELGLTLQNLKARLDAQEAAGTTGFSVKWKDGLRVESEDVKLKFGGRIMFDMSSGSHDDDLEAGIGGFEDGAEFRRARWYASGSVNKQVSWKAQYDFAGGEAEFKDLYIRFNEVPGIDNVTVGQQYEPFGLEEQTSSNYITFMERGNVFAPSRSSGLRTDHTFGEDDRIYAGIGVFAADDDKQGAFAEDGATAFTGRLTGLPVYQPDNERLLHLGAAFSSRSPSGDKVKYEFRPDNHLAPKYLKTGDIMGVEGIDIAGVEAAYVDGPFSVQAELASVDLDRSGGMEDLDFTSAYAYASYFLTGESRPYKKNPAVFGRVIPNDPWIGDAGNRGWGAWELAYRISHTDLNDKMVQAGELTSHTLGINWHLSRNTRIMLNHVGTELDDAAVEGDGSIWALRFQTDF